MLLPFVPGGFALLPWLVLSAAGGRECVVVITGVLPPEVGAQALLLGPSYILAHLTAVVLAPPLLAAPILLGVTRYIAAHVAAPARGSGR